MPSNGGSDPHQRQQHGAPFDQLAADVLNTLAEEVAVLDAEGYIVATNDAWRAFASQNDLQAGSLEGSDYLGAIDDHDDEYASAAATGLRAVLEDDR